MLKSILLTLTFAIAFGTGAISLTDQADAQWRWVGPYPAYNYGPPAYDYGYNAPYRYGTYYAPRSYYYVPSQPYYYGSYYYGSPEYYRPVPQVALREGWWR